MPELPEVQTTVNGLNRTVKGRKILAVSTTYPLPHQAADGRSNSAYYRKDNLKNPKFVKLFKKKVTGANILRAERRAKNVLIHLSNGYTIIAHMKMTGHFVYDRPDYPYARLILTLDGGPSTKLGVKKLLTLSDMRKFAKVTLVKTSALEKCFHLEHLGPEPLDPKFRIKNFESRIKMKPKGKIKQVLMDQSLIAGIGNIYADEILWRADVHPLSRVEKIPEANMKKMFRAMKQVLKKGIDFGGDSMSDYRNIRGERGKFQDHHEAYRRTGKKCTKRSCGGTIARTVVGARSAHFCGKHQKLFK